MTVLRPSPPTSSGGPSAGRRSLALLGISFGYFMVLLDMTVLSVAEPDLAASLHTSIAGLQWATTGYTVVFGALLLSAGAVADRYGAHRVFRVGVAVFGLGSLLSAQVSSLALLVVLRAVLGAAGAACVPASLALIARLYPDATQRTRAVAVWASISGAAVATGPITGGLLVDLAGWQAIFLINVPIAVLVLALTGGRAITCARGDRRIDWPAQLAALAALAVLTDTLVAAGSRSWFHAAISGTATLALAAIFIVLERRSQAPVLNRALLRNAGVRACLATGAAVNFTLNGSLFVLPLVFQQDRDFTATASGLAFLPLTLPFVLNPPVTAQIMARFGLHLPILTGMTLLTTGSAGLGYSIWTQADYPWLALALLANGFGISFVLPAVVAATITAAPIGTAGAAGGLLNATRQTGATLGVAALGPFLTVNSAYALLLAAAVSAAAALYYATTTRSA